VGDPILKIRITHGVDVALLMAEALDTTILAFTNPTSTPVRWGYDLFVDVAGEPGYTPGPAYCDARFSSPVVSSGTIVVRPHGVATVTLVWPHCKGNCVPPRSGCYTLSVTATSSVGTTSSDSQIVHVAS
jgi:hypothetical protein